MHDDDSAPIREFNDRGAIWLLGSPVMLRDLVRLVESDIARELDFSRARRINRSFIPDDLKKRESDVVFLIPYRDGSGEVFIYLIVEQQTKPDPMMAWRLLETMVFLWDQQRREYMDQDVPAGQWKLWPVIPLVFYTGATRWESPGSLKELMDLPRAIERFVPKHDILFLSLKDARLDGANLLEWLLKVQQAIDGPVEALAELVTKAVNYLDNLPEEAQGEWARGIHYLLLLIRHNRDRTDREQLYQRVNEVSDRRRDEVEAMRMTDAQELMEEGEKVGRQEGEKAGRLGEARAILLRQGSRKFGVPTQAVVSRLEAENSPERLEDLADRLLEVSSWDELLGA